MIKKIEYAPEAIAGIRAISRHVSENFSEAKARVIENGIVAHIYSLRSKHSMYPYFNMSTIPPTRKTVFNNRTVILYRVTEGSILIDLVADGRTDWAGGQA